MKGEIDSYDEEGKCGFIVTEDGEEFFFQKDLKEADFEVGDQVEFEISESDKGSEAKGVKSVN